MAMEPPEVVEETEEAEGREGDPASPGQGRREGALSHNNNEILIAILKK